MARIKNNGGDSNAKPHDWKVIAISIYAADLQRLDALVVAARERGHTKASRSGLIRAALATLDLDLVPKSPF